MKAGEAIILAKIIRNLIHTPMGYKTEFVNAICKEMIKVDQFFNVKQFRTIALDHFPKGWPNNMDGPDDQDETS